MVSKYPETRARTSTDSIATKRPTYSSCSAIILLTGLATVTCGGGGAADCDCDALCPQAASAGAMATIAAMIVLFMRVLFAVGRDKAAKVISVLPAGLCIASRW